MVDYNKLNRDERRISSSLLRQINEIKEQSGKANKIDHHKEYEQLQELLNGGKYKGDNKEYIEGLMIDYEDQYETSKTIREKVLDIVGKDKKVDDENEKKQLESLKKGANGFDKEYIKRVIDGKEAVEVEPDNENFELEEPLTLEDEDSEVDDKNSKLEIFPEENFTTGKPIKLPFTPEADDPKKGILPYPAIPNPNDKPVKLPDIINTPNESIKINQPTLRINQDGEVNVIAENGSTVIINDKKDEGIKKEDELKDGIEYPKTTEPDEPKKLSAKEKAEARSYGAQVNDLLTNIYTERDEQIAISNIIRENINTENVLEFLKGYEAKKSGDPFFEQIMREWDFEEKEALVRDVAEKLKENLETTGHKKEAEEISIILEKGFLTRNDAKFLDKIVKRHLSTR